MERLKKLFSLDEIADIRVQVKKNVVCSVQTERTPPPQHVGDMTLRHAGHGRQLAPARFSVSNLRPEVFKEPLL